MWHIRLGEKFKRLQVLINEYSFLSGSMIKIITMTLMLFDHFCKIVLLWVDHNIWNSRYESGEITFEKFQELDNFLRFDLFSIGTIAFPIFCFLVAEGFYYTRNKEKYCLLMGVFALISEIPFDIGFFHNLSILDGTYPFYWEYQNVFFTIFLGAVALWGIENVAKNKGLKSMILKASIVIIISLIADIIKSDYGSQGIIYIVGFYILRKHRLYQIVYLLVMFVLTTGNQPDWLLGCSVLIIALYNGKRGNVKNKYFFYWFYPVHIILLTLIRVGLETMVMR